MRCAPRPKQVAWPTCSKPSASPSRYSTAGETAAVLEPELAARDPFPQQRGRLPARFSSLSQTLSKYRFDHIEADQLGQLEQPRRPAQATSHRGIAVCN